MTWYNCLFVSTATVVLAGLGSPMAAAAEPTQAVAAANSETGAIAEVVVTARKREESLQKIPIAVTAKTGEELAQARVMQPTDLARVSPSLQIRASSGSSNSAQISLRGQFAADAILGASQPIGMYMDGVNVPHPFGANNSFFDIARVEVLKGPQGTLYGRNTTAGAVSIISRGADYSGVHGFLEGEYGTFDSTRVAGAVNLPLIQDVLAVRLVAQHWSKDGFGHSLTTGEKFGDGHDDDLVRLSAKFDPAPNFTAILKAEYGKAHNNGAMLGNLSVSGVTAAQGAALWSDYTKYAPLLALGVRGNTAALNQVVAAGNAILAPCIGQSFYTNCSATPEFDSVKTWHGALDMSWDVTDSVMLRSITGVHYFKNFQIFDLDGVQPQILAHSLAAHGNPLAPTVANYVLPYNLDPVQTSTQWSQEFNLSGKGFGDRLNWLVGSYFSRDRGYGSQPAAANTEAGPILAGGDPTNPLLLNIQIRNTESINVDSDSWALFTQNDFQLSDRLSVTLGGRYTKESLRNDVASWVYNTANGTFLCGVGGLQAPGNQRAACAFLPAAQTFAKASFHGFTYLGSVNYQLAEDTLVYAKVARGFRGGAFGRTNAAATKPEWDQDYEAGLKTEFLDRRLRLNLAAYQSKITNKQVSSLACRNLAESSPCTVSGFTTVINNAASARIRGVEVEWLAVPVTGLRLFGNWSYTDATYLDWPGATTSDGTNLISPGNPTGNAAGLPVAGTPKWQGNIGARYEFPFSSGVVAVQTDYEYRGAYALTPINNQGATPDAIERKVNGSVGLVNARIEMNLPDQGLSIALWATNLTDKAYGYMGISPNFVGNISHVVVRPPRNYGITIRKSFGAE